MDSLISKNLKELNSERIELKSELDDLKARSFRHRLDKVVYYLKTGNLKYILHKNHLADKSKLKPATQDDSIVIDRTHKVAIYTVVFGAYDNLRPPMFFSDHCDYFVLTDQTNVNSQNGYQQFDLSKFEAQTEGMSTLEKARFYKTHPHLLFPEYEYSVFVDGNVQIVADITYEVKKLGKSFIAIHDQPGRDCIYDEAIAIVALGKANKSDAFSQVNEYFQEGFPKHFGMFQTNVLVRRHNQEECIAVMEQWWNEMSKHTKRDQLSLTYSLWKNGFKYEDVSLLGLNTAKNPTFKVIKHK